MSFRPRWPGSRLRKKFAAVHYLVSLEPREWPKEKMTARSRRPEAVIRLVCVIREQAGPWTGREEFQGMLIFSLFLLEPMLLKLRLSSRIGTCTCERQMWLLMPLWSARVPEIWTLRLSITDPMLSLWLKEATSVSLFLLPCCALHGAWSCIASLLLSLFDVGQSAHRHCLVTSSRKIPRGPPPAIHLLPYEEACACNECCHSCAWHPRKNGLGGWWEPCLCGKACFSSWNWDTQQIVSASQVVQWEVGSWSAILVQKRIWSRTRSPHRQWLHSS